MQNKRLLVILLAAGLAAALLQNFVVQASVTLSDFRAQGSSSHITLFWETATELDNFGFHLWRGQTNSLDNASRITANLIPSQVGGQPIGASYEYEDNTTQPDTIYFYWLEAIDVNALSVFYGPEQGVMSNSNPLGTATPGNNDATPPPTSTIPRTNTPPPANTAPANTAAPSPTVRLQTSPTPVNTPPSTTNAAAPDPTKIAVTTATEAGLPTNAPPAAGIPPTTQADLLSVPPQPTGIPAAVSGAAAAGSESPSESDAATGDQTAAANEDGDSQLQIVGANTPLETPAAAPGVTAAATTNSLSPIALLGLAAGVLLSIGGILTAVALFKRRQTSK